MRISVSTHHVSFKALVIAGAAGNFMSVKLAQQLKLKMDVGASVMVASSAYQSSYVIRHPLHFSIHQYNFCNRFLAMPNLVFPVILGVGWWRQQHVKINLESNTLSFTNDDSEGEFPLIDTLKKYKEPALSLPWLPPRASWPISLKA